MFYFHPYLNDPIWQAYFSNGLVQPPPSRYLLSPIPSWPPSSTSLSSSSSLWSLALIAEIGSCRKNLRPPTASPNPGATGLLPNRCCCEGWKIGILGYSHNHGGSGKMGPLNERKVILEIHPFSTGHHDCGRKSIAWSLVKLFSILKCWMQTSIQVLCKWSLIGQRKSQS